MASLLGDILEYIEFESNNSPNRDESIPMLSLDSEGQGMCYCVIEIKHKRLVFNSLNVGSDTNLSHPEFPRVTGEPGGGNVT